MDSSKFIADFLEYTANKKYKGQECQDDNINKAFKNLHEHLVNEIIGFCKAWNISSVDEFHLSGDNLKDSIKFGSWHPSTDSCLSFYKNSKKYNKEPYLISI